MLLIIIIWLSSFIPSIFTAAFSTHGELQANPEKQFVFNAGVLDSILAIRPLPTTAYCGEMKNASQPHIHFSHFLCSRVFSSQFTVHMLASHSRVPHTLHANGVLWLGCSRMEMYDCVCGLACSYSFVSRRGGVGISQQRSQVEREQALAYSLPHHL